MAQTIVSSPFTDNRMSLAVTHTSHGFDSNDIGKAVRSSGTDGQFVVARANTAANAEVVGVITSIDSVNQYTITTSGFVDVVAAVPTATAGTVFFLAEAADSQLTSTEPTTAGAVSKPVAVITESDAKMLLIHYRGEVITSAVVANAPNDATYVTTTANSSLTNEVLASALKIDDFAAGDDNTDLDSSASRHGLLLKLGGGTTNFLRADGTWNAPTGGIASVVADTTPQLGGNLDMQARLLVGNGGSTGIAISSAGEVTMAVQPSFGVEASTGQNNVTGSDQTYIVEWDELWDVGANFASDVFTAPVAGKYFMIAHIDLDGIAASGGHNTLGVWFKTVGGTSIVHYFDLEAFRYNTSFPAVCVLDLAANDAIRIEINGSGASGGQSLDVLAGDRTHWMGMLLG